MWAQGRGTLERVKLPSAERTRRSGGCDLLTVVVLFDHQGALAGHGSGPGVRRRIRVWAHEAVHFDLDVVHAAANVAPVEVEVVRVLGLEEQVQGDCIRDLDRERRKL